MTWEYQLTTTNENENTKNTQYKWDLGLKYHETKDKLIKEIENLKNKEILYKNDIKRLAYLIILLTQLRNGCRIGEAITAIVGFCSNIDRINWEYPIIAVKVEKRKDNHFREIILPKYIKKHDLEIIKNFILNLKDEYEKEENKEKAHKKIISKISMWAKRNLGINTHSLRYAYITYKAEKQRPAQIIAKITGHKNLDMIVDYTQTQLARKELLNEEDD
ncbi:tyrosine-type recombinase/integrase [Methanotorris igneus]|uniref:Integrase family protein n=1 Tax=Methanotorris igneus (strain DSM 5666 / JCM 11834 / Kol 5) TaxID=880724 RepID=F6BDS3_METIK|nr:tyrosine-type recombinase/integrase [Methanotorris igneus]AEF96634.1 integrase family protein [Methanotorris igneus Kol 5]